MSLNTDSLVFATLYQVTPWMMGLLLKWLIPYPAVRAIFVLPGTFVHELLHLIVGLVLNGKPVSISFWPRRVSHGQWVLGTVGFTNLQWYNAVFIGLAPLLAIVGAMLMTPSPVHWSPGLSDLQQWTIATPILAMCMPSSVDLKLSLKSWPIICALLGWTAWTVSK